MNVCKDKLRVSVSWGLVGVCLLVFDLAVGAFELL